MWADGSIAYVHVFQVGRSTLVVGVVLLLLGLLFLGVGVLPFVLGGNLSTIPLPVRIIFAFFGLISIMGGYYQAKFAPETSRIMRRLSREVGVESDKLILPRPFRLKRGRLSIALEKNKGYETRFSIDESDEQEVIRDSLGPEDFAGTESIVANLDWSRLSFGIGPVSVGAVRDIVEWISLPCYIIREEGYTTPAFDTCIALYRKPTLPIKLRRGKLQASHERDVARADIEVRDGVIHGRIEYYRAPGSRSRGARIEITGVYEGIRYRARIAEIRNPGSLEFRWPARPREPLYIIISNAGVILFKEFLKNLGITEPVILGSAWQGMKNARIRLVLDIAMARDVVDEEEIIVLPQADERPR